MQLQNVVVVVVVAVSWIGIGIKSGKFAPFSHQATSLRYEPDIVAMNWFAWLLVQKSIICDQVVVDRNFEDDLSWYCNSRPAVAFRPSTQFSIQAANRMEWRKTLIQVALAIVRQLLNGRAAKLVRLFAIYCLKLHEKKWKNWKKKTFCVACHCHCHCHWEFNHCTV